MAEILEVLELVDEHGVAQVKIGSRRIEPGFHSQRPLVLERAGKFALQFGRLNDLHGSAENQIHLFGKLDHNSLSLMARRRPAGPLQ